MSELQRGTLKVKKKGQETMIQVRFNDKLFIPARGELSSDLTPSDGLEVDFLRVGGQPKQVRAAGGQFVPPRAAPKSGQNDRRGSPAHDQTTGHRVRLEPDFHNPYNFIPAPPRQTDHPDLGDALPVAQDFFDPERYTGRIRVRMTATTPLLVPDTDPANVYEDDDGHKTFKLRKGADDLPAIPSSSVRGMLRGAYEAVTNSRFRRFSSNHEQRLMYRQSRRPYDKIPFQKSPWELLDDSLCPATSRSELSPADRVFGWVRTNAQHDLPEGENDRIAARGLLRVGPVTCESKSNDAIDSFDAPGISLAILASPKPQQGRFYVAKSRDGDAQDDGLDKVQAGYAPGKGLRGRKVYPHQRGLAEDHWDTPGEDRTQKNANGRHQEYRRPHEAQKEEIRRGGRVIERSKMNPDGSYILLDGQAHEQRDDQNRSILGWVKPGATFTFEIYVQNLSNVELGALLWLLKLPHAHYFRLGGGKPLGFGSVRLTMDDKECDLRTGDELRARYSAWKPAVRAGDPSATAIEEFKQAIVAAYPPNQDNKDFDDILFIKAFRVACKGFEDNLPTHYPRATENGQPGPPSPDGESFRWFVANEKNGARYALRDLTQEGEPGFALPTLTR